jgi:hypothetical protein
MGCGRTGAQLAANLDVDGHQVTILDINDYSFRRLPGSAGPAELQPFGGNGARTALAYQ